MERNESQDNYRRPVDRERQNSTNNLAVPRSNSIQNNHNRVPKPLKAKPSNTIGPEIIKPSIDPIPLSVRKAMGAPMSRPPLKSKN